MNIDDWYSMIEIWSLILDDGFWRGYWIVLDDWFIRYNEACIGSHSIERERDDVHWHSIHTSIHLKFWHLLIFQIFSFSRSPTCCFISFKVSLWTDSTDPNSRSGFPATLYHQRCQFLQAHLARLLSFEGIKFWEIETVLIWWHHV